MATRNYFERMMPRRGLRGFYWSPSSSSDRGAFSLPSRRFQQNYPHDAKYSTDKTLSSSSSSIYTPLSSKPTVATNLLSGQGRERGGSATHSPSRSEMSTPHHQSSVDLVASSLKCDDCQTNDGLFQCCHCNQHLCIKCCNKHYENITIELERVHELSDRLAAKILHTKNDLERQKNETLEQCHKWRVDTINTINKAHALIVQTIHNEYETLGKEYELFVQKEMAHIHVDQNELMRMKKTDPGSLLSSSTNSVDTIRTRIETFAKTIDETGKFSFQVKLPTFDIDDRLRVESCFGDVTRSTSATWQNANGIPFSLPNDGSTQDNESFNNVQSTETDLPLNNNDNDVIINRKDEIEEVPDKIDEQKPNIESRGTILSPSTFETNDRNSISLSSSRYALSVENNIELQQQQFYSPGFRSDRYDSAYGTAPSSPNNLLNNTNDQQSSTVSLQEESSKNFFYPPNNESDSFHNNHQYTHGFHQTSSPNSHDIDDEDTFRSVSYVQLKREVDGSIEGVAIQFEQSHQTDGKVQTSRTCMESCGVRRRTVVLVPRSPSSSSTTDQPSNDQPGFYYRTDSTPDFLQ